MMTVIKYAIVMTITGLIAAGSAGYIQVAIWERANLVTQALNGGR